MRSNFDKELDILNTHLTDMSAAVENAIEYATQALVFGDMGKAETAVEYDSEVDSMEKDIEKQCVKILLLQQPVAKDLRQVSAALKMITDMERIGDQARDISELLLKAGRNVKINPNGVIAQMATATMKMVHDAAQSFVKQDIQAAHNVIEFDDVIDNLYEQAKAEIVHRIKSEKEDVDFLIDLLSISKYFERIGDHTASIAEWVIFSVTGVHKDENMMYTEKQEFLRNLI